MTYVELMMIVATAVSPLIAVQVTRRLDDRNEAVNRKLAIFKTLMATRANTLDPRHVESLNRIDLEFYGDSKSAMVVSAWHDYLNHLNNHANINPDLWDMKRKDLFVELLYKMGVSLSYKFTKIQLENAIYTPRAYGAAEIEKLQVKQYLMELLEGNRSIPFHLTGIADGLAEKKASPE